jgi:hypothetical protein
MYQTNFVADALYICTSALQLTSHARHICVNACSDHQRFCFCHASLLLRQFVQLLKRVLDTTYSKKLLDIFLCAVSNFGEKDIDEGHTEWSLLDFLGHDPKDRNNLDHDLNDDVRHSRCRSDLYIHLKPLEKEFHAAK